METKTVRIVIGNYVKDIAIGAAIGAAGGAAIGGIGGAIFGGCAAGPGGALAGGLVGAAGGALGGGFLGGVGVALVKFPKFMFDLGESLVNEIIYYIRDLRIWLKQQELSKRTRKEIEQDVLNEMFPPEKREEARRKIDAELCEMQSQIDNLLVDMAVALKQRNRQLAKEMDRKRQELIKKRDKIMKLYKYLFEIDAPNFC